MNGTKPISREEMAKYLLQIIENDEKQNQLNSVEREQLELLKIEFQEKLQKSGAEISDSGDPRIRRFKKLKWIDPVMPDMVYKNNRNFLAFEYEAFKINIDPVLYREALFASADTLESTEKVYQDLNGFQFWGNLGSQLGFYFDVRDTKEWGSRTYPRKHKISRERLGFVNGYGSHIYHDETVAYLMFKLPYFSLMLGKDKNKWGPGYSGNLALSDWATSYDQIKLQIKYWRFKFTSFTGFLRAYPEIYENGELQSKSLSAHRIELNLHRHLQIGLHETMIYGGRLLEPAYLNPIMFYRSAEHYLAYEDNAAMGLDVDWSALRNLKFYGELFIDDITTSELGTGFYGNKLGYQAGLFAVNLFKIPNLDGRLEYTRIRPYVYSHKRAISVYQHFNTILGHRIGPNSDDLLLALKYRYSKSLIFETSFEQQRWGANTDSVNYGRNPVFNNGPGDPVYLDLLSGQKHKLYVWNSKIQYELFRNFYFNLEYSQATVKSEPFENETGTKIYRKQFMVSIGINY